MAQDSKLVEYVHGLSEKRLAESLDYATSSGAQHSQPLHHVPAHLFNHQTHHRGQATTSSDWHWGRRRCPSSTCSLISAPQGPRRTQLVGRNPQRDRDPMTRQRVLSRIQRPPLVATDAYAEAADPAGEVKSTKQLPEPDSLGG
jgi:hypothetical protein